MLRKMWRRQEELEEGEAEREQGRWRQEGWVESWDGELRRRGRDGGRRRRRLGRFLKSHHKFKSRQMNANGPDEVPRRAPPPLSPTTLLFMLPRINYRHIIINSPRNELFMYIRRSTLTKHNCIRTIITK